MQILLASVPPASLSTTLVFPISLEFVPSFPRHDAFLANPGRQLRNALHTEAVEVGGNLSTKTMFLLSSLLGGGGCFL